jgi:catechol 2,3-dioxygenase-like lactoylglutathione lyase family enzyme
MNICISIYVSTMDSSIEFYTKLCGLQVISDVTIGSGQRYVRLGYDAEKAPHILLQLVEPASESDKRVALLPAKKNWASIEFNVEDFLETLAMLEARGMTPVSTNVGHCYEQAEFADPDGRVVTLQRINVQGLDTN